jgi:hypothetical protein
MNPERVLAVAAAIKAAPAHKFNMKQYFLDLATGANICDSLHRVKIEECSTAACVAGWTNIARGANGNWSGPSTEALWLDLNIRQQNALFNPPGWADETVTKKRFTKSRAVAVLKHLAETGVVRWDRFDTRGWKIA